MIRICKRVVWVFFMALLMLASYCYLRFQEEQRWLAVKARQITDQAGAHTQRERIMAIRDYLRRHVKWRGAAFDDRVPAGDRQRDAGIGAGVLRWVDAGVHQPGSSTRDQGPSRQPVRVESSRDRRSRGPAGCRYPGGRPG